MATATALRASADSRGQYGGERKKTGAGGALIILGVATAIYAFSPGALHWYKHGRLPG